MVLDLDGIAGVQTVALNAPGTVYWDIDNDGFREASGWVSGNDGLLTIDLNADGKVNNNSELFGNTNSFANGFAALDAYDSNSDDQITVTDIQFGNLRVWIDADHDGISDTGELHSLTSLGMTSISTTWTDVNINSNGNTIKQTSTFTQNGNTKQIVDMWFAYDNANTKFGGTYTPDVDTIYLPTLRGYGNIANLSIGMSIDNTGAGNLKSLVQAFNDKTFEQLFDASANQLNDIKAILFRWAGVDNISASSRGPYVDARELAFLEKLSGTPFLQQGISDRPYGPEAGYDIQESFSQALNHFAARLVFQSKGNELIYTVGYDPVDDKFVGTPSLDLTKLDALKVEALALSTTAQKADFWENVVRMLEFTVGTSALAPSSLTALENAITSSDATLDLQDDILPGLAFIRPEGVIEGKR